MNMYILNDKDEPVRVSGVMQWAYWKAANRERLQIALDQFDNIGISTVFLGLDHSIGFGPPQLYETMIFGGEHNRYQTRCSTREQALEMHRDAVRLVKIGRTHEVIEGESWTSETR